MQYMILHKQVMSCKLKNYEDHFTWGHCNSKEAVANQTLQHTLTKPSPSPNPFPTTRTRIYQDLEGETQQGI